MVDDVLPDGAFGRRVRDRLRTDRLIWFTTTSADGTPAPNPVWFVWEEPGALLTYNRPRAARVGHIAARSHVSLHFDSGTGGDDIVVISGTAERADDAPPPDRNDAYLAKYATAMARVSGSTEQFAADYPVPVRIRIERVRGH